MARPASSRAERPAERSGSVDAHGVLELLSTGSGFLRLPENGFQPSPNDVFVPPQLIRKFSLRTGDHLAGTAGPPPGRDKSPPLESISYVNGMDPDHARERPEFGRLPAAYPSEQLKLEFGLKRGRTRDHTNRVIDLISPLGKGQRALIVAPARAGKTMLLQAIIEGVASNHPEALLLILLVDERPEEVTEMQMLEMGTVISSSFDLPADRHVAVAEMTLEYARRQVESGRDVVILLDSLTRLARAYNASEAGTGRTLSGGIDSGALEKPKRFFGSARKPAKSDGSLTIIATALTETGSRGDEVIFEEFKGTGNAEIVLDREIADRRVFPAINIERSATRKEELLLSPEALKGSHQLRRALHSLPPVEAIQLLLRQMEDTENNEELMKKLAGGR